VKCRSIYPRQRHRFPVASNGFLDRRVCAHDPTQQAVGFSARASASRSSVGQSELLEIGAIHRLVDERPTYGYRRIAALLKSERQSSSQAPVNTKRIYRLMKKHGLLLERHTGRRASMTTRWRRSTRIADVRVAFALATPAGISAR